MSFDFEQVRAFAQTLERKSNKTPRQARGVVSKGALNIKNAWQADAAKSRHFKQVAPTISYDMRASGSIDSLFVEAEIGPNKRFRAARLANIYIFGTSRGGGTGTDPMKFVRDELPSFEKFAGDIGQDLS